jgi:membrane-bound serine protease (ClpP class)
MGAATVVDQGGAGLPDKYQSYMRSMMRSTAEAHGRDTIIRGRDTTYHWHRDPQIAEAMVDDRIVKPGLIDSGKTLTLTAEEAVRWGYCEGIAESLDEVITKYLGYGQYELVGYSPSWLDDLRGFLLNPMFQSVLILLIIGGIYFELQTPGIGFPLAASVIAAILYFAPLYVEGLAANWEILLFILGVILVLVEIFVIPGFGLCGIGGMALMLIGFVLGLLNNTSFNFEGISGLEIGRAWLTVGVGLILGMTLVLYLSHRIGHRGIFRHVALTSDLSDSVTSMPVDLSGKIGITSTVLRPSGKVIIAGETYDGISESGFIECATSVRVIRHENAQLYVERYEITSSEQ